MPCGRKSSAKRNIGGRQKESAASWSENFQVKFTIGSEEEDVRGSEEEDGRDADVEAKRLRTRRHGGSKLVVPMMEKSHWAAGVCTTC